MNIYQRIVLIIGAVVLVVVLLNTPTFFVYKGSRLHNSNGLNLQRQTDMPNAIVRSIAVIGSTILLYFALNKIENRRRIPEAGRKRLGWWSRLWKRKDNLSESEKVVITSQPVLMLKYISSLTQGIKTLFKKVNSFYLKFGIVFLLLIVILIFSIVLEIKEQQFYKGQLSYWDDKKYNDFMFIRKQTDDQTMVEAIKKLNPHLSTEIDNWVNQIGATAFVDNYIKLKRAQPPTSQPTKLQQQAQP